MGLRKDEDRRRVEGGGEKQGRHRGSETREREKAKGEVGTNLATTTYEKQSICLKKEEKISQRYF